MPTINVLTFNVFENGYACCGSLHGSLKPRQYLDSSSQTFFPSPTEGLHRLSVSDIPSYWSVFGRNIFKRSDFGRIVVKPTDCSLSVFNASSLLENRFRSLEKDTSLSRNVSVSAMLVSMRQKNIAQVSILERYFFVSTYQAAGPDTCLAVFVVASLPLCL